MRDSGTLSGTSTRRCCRGCSCPLSGMACMACMAGWDDVTTYEQLQEMTPAEREAHFDASIIWRLEDVPEQYRPILERQEQRILEREARLRGKAS